MSSESILKILRGESEREIVWAPRLEQWYEVNRFTGNLPPEYRDKSLLEICDDLGTSPRTYYFFNETIKVIQEGDVKVSTTEDSQRIESVYSTPKGKLKEVRRKQIEGLASPAVSPYWSEHLVKEIEDIQILKYILENQVFEFDRELYETVKGKVGDRAPPTIECPAVPIASLTITYLGLLKTNIWLRKYLKAVEGLLQVLDDYNGRFLEAVRNSPIPIINFGDNIDRNLFSPIVFSKYILPYYKRRTAELHASGKLCTAHWDGKLNSLLQYARETGLDGIECITPQPQGDVTLGEVHAALGDMILLDGIPAITFLPWAKDSELEAFTRNVLQMFLPHLILGASDLVPPNVNIEKIRLVTRIVEKFRENMDVAVGN